jgi:hypothetical protein
LATDDANTMGRKSVPDGLSREPYLNVLRWSKGQWAWQFLRRNKKFQDDCNLAEADPAQARAIARKWGLVTFKHAREPYEGRSGKPRFAATRLRARMAIDNAGHDVNVLRLYRGELGLAMRLDLLTSELAIRYFVGRLEKAIRRHVPPDALLGRNRSYQTQNLAEVLRVFDARRAGRSWLVAARAIVPRDANDPNPDKGDWDPQTAKEKLRVLDEKANQLVDGDYIYLALLANKLDVVPHPSLAAAIEEHSKASKTSPGG